MEINMSPQIKQLYILLIRKVNWFEIHEILHIFIESRVKDTNRSNTSYFNQIYRKILFFSFILQPFVFPETFDSSFFRNLVFKYYMMIMKCLFCFYSRPQLDYIKLSLIMRTPCGKPAGKGSPEPSLLLKCLCIALEGLFQPQSLIMNFFPFS